MKTYIELLLKIFKKLSCGKHELRIKTNRPISTVLPKNIHKISIKLQ